MQHSVIPLLFILAGATGLSIVETIQQLVNGHIIKPNAFIVPFAIGSLLGFVFFVWYRKSSLLKDRMVHLNLVLKTIRKVSQLIAQEKDRERLLQGVCDNLVKYRGYYNAWIALMNDTGEWESLFESGLGKEFEQILGRLQKGRLISCCQRALAHQDIIVTDEPTTLCADCPRANYYENNSAITSRLEYNSRIYGVMTLSLPKKMIFDLEEQKLVKEIARDIAIGIYSFEVRGEREETTRALHKSMDALSQRVKELNCLFGLSKLVEEHITSLENIFQGVVELIPPAWQYSDITCAKIEIEKQEFRTANYRETAWQLTQDIIVDSRIIGIITVGYLEDRPTRYEGPFLREERKLINELTERLGRLIEGKEAEKVLLSSEKRFRTLVENSPTGISIAQENTVVYQNKEQERLLGPLPRQSILGDSQNIHPDDLDKVHNLSEDITSGKTQTIELDFRYFREDNVVNPIWVYCRASIIDYRQKESILVNMVDMTQVKRLEELLRMQDKMASLGRVTAGIAHEIRNPLSGINIYTNTLEKYIRKGENEEKINNVLQHMQSASRKIESIIRRVMDFSKPSAPNFTRTDINQPVEEAIKLTSVTLRKSGIKLEIALSDKLPKCHLDATQIEEVILNLLNNAADALRNSTDEKRIMVMTAVDRECVTLRVIDSGPGLPDNYKDKIFDPFFTTKPDSTGIGLSICRRIIVDHGGTLSVHSSQWGGAEFLITIPLSDHNPE
ncbi:ATP-binding protein [Thermodesulfobacteriota bacterium]